ncbi:putative ribonuclease H-like domain-containing protein [Tanacetum coccineum]
MALSFMRPFGCPVTILNTIDHLGKFDGKADEGFFVGYSTNSKAFRVFNSRTRIVEENLACIQFVDHLLLKEWEEEKKDAEDPGNEGGNLSEEGERINQEKDAKDNAIDENIVYRCADDPNIPDLEEIGRFSDAEDDGAEADITNLDTHIPVSPIPTTRIHKDYLIEQIIKEIYSAPQTRRMTKKPKKVIQALKDLSQIEAMNKKDERGIVIKNKERIEAIRLFLAYASYKGFVVYKMDVKSAFLYGKIEEEVYVCQPPGFKIQTSPTKIIYKGWLEWNAKAAKDGIRVKTEVNVVYDTPSHTKNIFANMRRQGKDFSGTITPLFSSMLAQQAYMGKRSRQPTDPRHTTTSVQPSNEEPITVPSSSQPKKTHRPRKAKRATEISQSSGPIPLVTDETGTKEREDRMERAPTTASSLESEQGSGNINRTQSMATLNEPSPHGTGSGSGHRFCELWMYEVFKDVDGDAREVNTASAPVTTASVYVSSVEPITTASVIITTAEPITPPTTTTIFEDKDHTIAQTLVKMRSEKSKGKRKAIKEKGPDMFDKEIAQRHCLSRRWQGELDETAKAHGIRAGRVAIEEKSKLFVELMDKRKKHFARIKAEEQRRKPLTKAQKRNKICTYLKNMTGFTHNQLKNKIFDEVQKDFDKTMSWIDSFIPVDSEVVKGSKDRAENSETRVEGSSKRAGKIFNKSLPRSKLGRIVRIKRLLSAVEVTAAGYVGN